MRKRLGIFGGSFDPAHMGHLYTITSVLYSGLVDQIVVVPVHKHAFGKNMTPFPQRMAMAQRLISYFKHDTVRVSDVEQENTSGYTYDMIQHLRRWNYGLYKDHDLRLILGADQLTTMYKWHALAELIQVAPPIFVGRESYSTNAMDEVSQWIKPNADFLTEVPIPNVSSTEVRRRLAEGLDVSQLVPAAVLEYMQSQSIYQVKK